MSMRGLATAALVVGTMVVGCGGGAEQTVAMSPSSTVPAAMGRVNVSSGENGNTRVEVRVEHMAPPARVAENATSYVVWMKPTEGDRPAQNVGAIEVNKSLQGALRTVTPLRSFDLFVTAEQNAAAAEPSGSPLLATHVIRP